MAKGLRNIVEARDGRQIIESARAGGSTLQARVFDGSDTGSKIYDTMTVIGKVGAGPAEDASNSEALKGLARWPVTISYFDAAKKDSAAEYILTFDLYENGVSGSLKLDYGAFALAAHQCVTEHLAGKLDDTRFFEGIRHYSLVRPASPLRGIWVISVSIQACTFSFSTAGFNPAGSIGAPM